MKRSVATPILVGIFLLTASASGHAANWLRYRDQTHGCRIEYPGRLFSRDARDVEKDFQRFSGASENTYFRIQGVANEENLNSRQIRATYLKENAPGDVIYGKTKKDFLVVSGYKGRSIFYTRVAVSPDNKTLCIVEISYPRAEKRAFDPIVTRMSRSFRAEN